MTNWWPFKKKDSKDLVVQTNYVGQEKEIKNSGIRKLDGSVDFCMIPAEGGTILQVTHRYETKRDEVNMHIIPQAEDLPSSVAKIVTYELLKG